MIILASVIFSVHTVVGHCCNDIEDTLISAQVVEAADIGFTSIFMLNEDEIIEKIDSKVVYAEMNSIERIFPNKVSLHYDKLYDDIQFEHNGSWYVSSASGRILKAEKSDNVATTVKLGSAPASLSVGTYFNGADSADRVAIGTVVGRASDFVVDDLPAIDKSLFVEIDLSGIDIVITTSTGAKLILYANVDMIRGDADRIFEQLRLAVTAYLRSDIGKREKGAYKVSYEALLATYDDKYV